MENRGALAPESWWDARLSRLGVRGPFAHDLVLAVTVTVLMVLAAVGTFVAASADEPDARAALPSVVVVVAVQCLALTLRRVHLGICVVLTVTAQVALIALVPDVNVRTVAPFVVGATIGSTRPPARALRLAAAVALTEAAAASVVALARGAGADVVLQHCGSALIVWGASVLLGIYVATRRDHLRLLQERAEQLERERDARVRSAVADERARLARELHDVAAHHLSGMVVQAAAVERLVGRDPEAARAGALWLRDQGRETLDSLRQVVGLLRRDETPDGTAPVPGLAALESLVRGARELGDTVELSQVGTGSPLPPLADVSAYRVVQQSLTNARQHAPGAPVRVRVVHTPGEVVLEVTNGPDGRAAGPAGGGRGGAGLAVMRERAALVGGTLDAGPTHDGGWCVRLHVPVDDDRTVGA
ncbi:sensor histidine kinase [Cellulomonas sp. URHE0023]|uniref:sensor histidine kinase n=1 Tax=Cellulomonas sp. URHE0023 TaxID=1380354 RepID=UPI000AD3C772|nr:histidine kinase [Cellulomonas sp. URHE0023]